MTSASRNPAPNPDIADQDDPAKQAPGQPQPSADESDERPNDPQRDPPDMGNDDKAR